MKVYKFFLGFVLLMLFAFASPGFQTWAGNPPPASPDIVGPEYWGVLVVNCSNNTATLRVKRVVDCDVDTQALTVSWGSAVCPLTENDFLNQWFNGIIFNQSGTPIITKVKNFQADPESSPNVYSADVQIQFCTNCQ